MYKEKLISFVYTLAYKFLLFLKIFYGRKKNCMNKKEKNRT